MSITAFTGPVIAFGQSPSGSDYNGQVAPSLFTNGSGIMDPRLPFAYAPGRPVDRPTFGWLGTNAILTTSYAPSAMSATSIVAAAVPSGGALTLVSSSGSGITVGQSLVNSLTGAAVSSALLIDGPVFSVTASIAAATSTAVPTMTVSVVGSGTVLPGMVLATGAAAGTYIVAQLTGTFAGAGTYQVSVSQTVSSTTITGTAGLSSRVFGQDGSVRMWDPSRMVARNIRITSVGNDSGATFTVSGYDAYGYPMSEAITGPNATLASGKKAFKYLSSITYSGSLSGSNVSVGTGDVFGFPIRSDAYYSGNAGGDVQIVWNGVAITATTGYLAAVTLAATTTTGDVRGTYAVQSASDGTKRLVFTQSPSLANISSSTGLFGVAQA